MDIFSEVMHTSAYFQVEHAEAKKLLFPRAQQLTGEISSSPQSLIAGLKMLAEFPRREELQTVSKNIARKVLAKEIKGRAKFRESELVQKAIEKLETLSPSSSEWEEIHREVNPLTQGNKESIEEAYYDSIISRNENLWMLNARQNGQKGKKEFLAWVKEIITSKPGLPSERMSEYLYFWYARLKGDQALPHESFLTQFKEQCDKGPDPFGEGGILAELVHEPGPGEPFHKICVAGGSYTFAETLDIWFIKSFAPDVRTIQSLTKMHLRSTKISATINTAIRLAGDPGAKEQLQGILESYLKQADTTNKQELGRLIETIRATHGQLATKLDRVCEGETVSRTPLGTEKRSRIMSPLGQDPGKGSATAETSSDDDQ
jgi:hypothetical protein